MTLGIAQLIAAYVVLAALLAGLNIFSTLSWLAKALLLIATSAAYLVLYFSFPPLLGWPSGEDLPKRFGLIAVYVQEPDRITGAKGSVFFWVTDKSSSTNVPRAYLLDYDPELHARAREARAKLQKNVPQVGEAVSGDELDLAKMGKPGEERQGAKSHKYTVKFFDAAPEAPPSKTAEMPAPTDDGAAPPPP
ncbi:MAG: hypothetical protein NFCOHLIN_00690 [Gammaproteobacteria bacterium]|nr:hypothetical protein [Gammaproteobacteria bacterium]